MRRYAFFYALALAWAVLCGLVPPIGRAMAPEVPAAVWFTVAGVPMMFGPMVAAAIAGRCDGLSFAASVGFRWNPSRWWAIAWAAPVPFLLAVVLASALLPGIRLVTPLEAVQSNPSIPPEAVARATDALSQISPVTVAVAAVLAGLVAGATVNAVAAFGEEAGWRGYAPRALADAPFWPAALGTGALWGLWHAPLVLQGYDFPGSPWLGLAEMVLACALLAPPMLWLRGRARSTVASALLHGTFNGVAGLGALFLAGGDALVTGPLGLVAAGVLALIDGALLATTRRGARMRDVVPVD